MTSTKIKISTSIARQDIVRLLQEESKTPQYLDLKCGDVYASHCLLAAASTLLGCQGSAEYHALSKAPREIAMSLLRFSYGERIVLGDEAQVLELLVLAKNVGVSSCAEKCREAIGRVDSNSFPVTLQMSDEDLKIRDGRLRQFKLEGRFSDLTLKFCSAPDANSKTPAGLRVHRIVIGAASPYFAALLAHNFVDAVTEASTLNVDADPEIGRMLITLLYGESVELPEERLVDAFILADKWQVQHLSSAIRAHLELHLSAQSASELLQNPMGLPNALVQAALVKLVGDDESGAHNLDEILRNNASFVLKLLSGDFLDLPADVLDFVSEHAADEKHGLALMSSPEWLSLPVGQLASISSGLPIWQSSTSDTERKDAMKDFAADGVIKWAQHKTTSNHEALSRLQTYCTWVNDLDDESDHEVKRRFRMSMITRLLHACGESCFPLVEELLSQREGSKTISKHVAVRTLSSGAASPEGSRATKRPMEIPERGRLMPEDSDAALQWARPRLKSLRTAPGWQTANAATVAALIQSSDKKEQTDMVGWDSWLPRALREAERLENIELESATRSWAGRASLNSILQALTLTGTSVNNGIFQMLLQSATEKAIALEDQNEALGGNAVRAAEVAKAAAEAETIRVRADADAASSQLLDAREELAKEKARHLELRAKIVAAIEGDAIPSCC